MTSEEFETVTKLTSKVDKFIAECFDREFFEAYKVSIAQCLKNHKLWGHVISPLDQQLARNLYYHESCQITMQLLQDSMKWEVFQ
jgi:hypothetical protein